MGPVLEIAVESDREEMARNELIVQRRLHVWCDVTTVTLINPLPGHDKCRLRTLVRARL
jgi:hypothetical protein